MSFYSKQHTENLSDKPPLPRQNNNTKYDNQQHKKPVCNTNY